MDAFRESQGHAVLWRLPRGAGLALVCAALWLALFSGLLTGGTEDAGAVLAGVVGRLPRLAGWTFALALGVALGTLTLGAGLAWLTTLYAFPGHRWLSWALVLPMALPTYVLGFVLVGLLDFSGPLQSTLRGLGIATHAWPSIRSGCGAVLTLTLALYPYVYLLARDAFRSQGRQLLEAAQSLGDSRARAFFRAVLPMSRPHLAAGLGLVLMETLADFGTVTVFNVPTFTTAIYQAWFGLYSLRTAGFLAAGLVAAAGVLLVLEQRQRQRLRHAPSRPAPPEAKIPLAGWRGALASGAACCVLGLGFVAPVAQLAVWTARQWAEEPGGALTLQLGHSVVMAFVGALATVLVALGLALYKRRRPSCPAALWAVRLATLGYAVPGMVLAVALLAPLAGLDRGLKSAGAALGIETAPLLGGSLLVLLFAYVLRFLAVGFGAVDSAFGRIRANVEEAARSLGVGGLRLWPRLYLPLLGGGLGTAMLLVFVDVMKEMPMTLLIRPFGWDNLAVEIFGLIAEGLWQRAAPPALALVLLGLIPAALLVRSRDAS